MKVVVETIFHPGKKGKPLVVFIHGMGLSLKAWSDPTEARVLGGKYPLSVLVGTLKTEMETSFADLKKLGFPVLSWTQTRPAGPVQVAVGEMHGLMKEFGEYGRGGIVLIGHSRGGLIARKYMEESGRNVRAVITIASPHRGTSMARWGVFFSPAASALDKLIGQFSRKDVNSALRRILSFLGSTGLREMLPGSDFLLSLNERKLRNTRYLSAGGTNPDLLKGIPVSLPELMSRVTPQWLMPEEMRQGLGDGIVTAVSSVFPNGDEHRDFPVNHAEILFNTKVRDYITKSVESLI